MLKIHDDLHILLHHRQFLLTRKSLRGLGFAIPVTKVTFLPCRLSKFIDSVY